jgi:hypothetical protein
LGDLADVLNVRGRGGSVEMRADASQDERDEQRKRARPPNTVNEISEELGSY